MRGESPDCLPDDAYVPDRTRGNELIRWPEGLPAEGRVVRAEHDLPGTGLHEHEEDDDDAKFRLSRRT